MFTSVVQRCDARSVSIAAKIRELMDERGWNPTDLSRELERVRPERFSESWRVQVMRWLEGRPPKAHHADALADAFGVPAAYFAPAQISQAQLDELLADLESLRRRAAQAQTENSELRSQLERLAKADRRPQELLKPNAQRKASGS